MGRAKPWQSFGGRLKLARQALVDGTAEDFARQVGFKPQTYRNWERSDRCPREPEKIAALAREGISLDWLFLGEKPMIDAYRAAEAKQRHRQA